MTITAPGPVGTWGPVDEWSVITTPEGRSTLSEAAPHPTSTRPTAKRAAGLVALAMMTAALTTSCGTDASAGGDTSSSVGADSVVDVATTTAPDATTRPDATSTTTAAVATTTVPSTTAPAPAAVGLGALAGRTIAVDPGHNGRNYQHMAEINRQVDIGTKTKECDTTGTATDAGYTESAHNLDVADRLTTILQANGATVVLTRYDDNGWGPCITERAAIANRAAADAAISIHADGGPAGGRGFHVIYPVSIPGLTAAIAGPSQQLALAVRDAYATGTAMPYSTYLGNAALSVRDDLGGLNLSTVPKVFIETGNMRNATDAALLTDPAFRQNEAQAIANGLAAFLGG